MITFMSSFISSYFHLRKKKNLSLLLLKTLRILSSLVLRLQIETYMYILLTESSLEIWVFFAVPGKDQSRSQYLGKITENHEVWPFSGIK